MLFTSLIGRSLISLQHLRQCSLKENLLHSTLMPMSWSLDAWAKHEQSNKHRAAIDIS